jgi:hypothetical protein
MGSKEKVSVTVLSGLYCSAERARFRKRRRGVLKKAFAALAFGVRAMSLLGMKPWGNNPLCYANALIPGDSFRASGHAHAVALVRLLGRNREMEKRFFFTLTCSSQKTRGTHAHAVALVRLLGRNREMEEEPSSLSRVHPRRLVARTPTLSRSFVSSGGTVKWKTSLLHSHVFIPEDSWRASGPYGSTERFGKPVYCTTSVPVIDG